MRKIVLFVADGLSNAIIESLLNENKLPALKKLIDNGIKMKPFDIEKDDPWVSFSRHRSNINVTHRLGVHHTTSLWATLATGTMPEKHKIISSTEKDDMGIEGAVSRKSRKKPAMWEIISQHNKKIGVIGWIANWPPAPMPDYTIVRISDILNRRAPLNVTANFNYKYSLDDNKFLSDPTYPCSLWGKLKKIPFDSKIKELFQKVNQASPALFSLHRNVIYDSLYLEWAKFLLKQFPQPDFLAISLYQMHNLSHLFWDCLKMERSHFRGAVHRNRQKRFGYIIENYYQYLDKKIKEILGLIDNDSIVIIVSPYGMRKSKITKKYLWMNTVFEELGLLKYNGEEIDWEKTMVYDNMNPWGIFVKRKGFIKGNYPESVFRRLQGCLKKIKTERNENLFLEIVYNKKDISFEVLPNYKALHYSTKILLNNKYFPVKRFVDFIPHYSLHDYSDRVIIISGNDVRHIKTIKSNISLLDIAPTVFNLLGIKYSKKDIVGEPIVRFQKEE